MPGDWFTGAPAVTVDREEIIVTGELAAPEAPPTPTRGRNAAALGRISRFREDSREARMQIADEAETRYGRKVAWGASIGDNRVLFTHLAVPVMTRLRQDERRVLDTLVDPGVARSRSDALAWCVTLVGEHTDEWLGQPAHGDVRGGQAARRRARALARPDRGEVAAYSAATLHDLCLRRPRSAPRPVVTGRSQTMPRQT